jgi:hypothetical protein
MGEKYSSFSVFFWIRVSGDELGQFLPQLPRRAGSQNGTSLSSLQSTLSCAPAAIPERPLIPFQFSIFLCKYQNSLNKKEATTRNDFSSCANPLKSELADTLADNIASAHETPERSE